MVKRISKAEQLSLFFDRYFDVKEQCWLKPTAKCAAQPQFHMLGNPVDRSEQGSVGGKPRAA